MKKIFTLIFALIVAITLAACAGRTSTDIVAPGITIEATTAPTTETIPEETTPAASTEAIPAETQPINKFSTTITTTTLGNKPVEQPAETTPAAPTETIPTTTEPIGTTPTENNVGSHICQGEWVPTEYFGNCWYKGTRTCDICGHKNPNNQRIIHSYGEPTIIPATCLTSGKEIKECSECGDKLETKTDKPLALKLTTKTKNINGVIVEYEACEHCDTLHENLTMYGNEVRYANTKRIVKVHSYTLVDNSVWKVVLAPAQNNSLDSWKLYITNKTGEEVSGIKPGETVKTYSGSTVSVNYKMVSGREETVVERTETSVSVITTFIPDGRINETINQTFNFNGI